MGDVEPGAGRIRPIGDAGRAGEGGPPGPPDAGALTFPNALTALRLLGAPVFLALYVTGDVRRALAVYAVAAATDLLDGLAARVLHQHSRLGEILDPVADKLLALCALVALAATRRIPVWLPLLVVGRDVALVLGAALLQVMGVGRRLRIIPTRAGKYATFALALLVLGELAGDLEPSVRPALAPWLAATGLLVACAVVVSMLQYSGVFARALRGQPDPAQSR
jgi:cardiolipin synthase